MVAIIKEKIQEIEALCKQYGVTKLELFGSAATGEFDEATSDLDFLVEFERPGPMGAFDQFFGLLDALETLFRRAVDLVELQCVSNPYFLDQVNKHREVVYDA